MLVVVAGLVLVLSAVVTVVLTPMFGWLRAGGRPRSVLQRLLCRLGFHTVTWGRPHEVNDPADPCRKEFRCSACSSVYQAGQYHTYGPPGAKDQLCRERATCERCGHETVWKVSHRTRRVLVLDLTEAERPQKVPWRDRQADCRYVDICEDCGYQRFDEEHDWVAGACSKCGEPLNEA